MAGPDVPILLLFWSQLEKGRCGTCPMAFLDGHQYVFLPPIRFGIAIARIDRTLDTFNR
jgi:hypothetical protein